MASTQKPKDRHGADTVDAADPIYTAPNQGEVRAGPGDADGVPVDRKKKRGGRGLFIALLIAGPTAVLVFWMLAA